MENIELEDLSNDLPGCSNRYDILKYAGATGAEADDEEEDGDSVYQGNYNFEMFSFPSSTEGRRQNHEHDHEDTR